MSLKLQIKHRLVRSPLRKPLESVRGAFGKLSILHPELAILRREQDYIDDYLDRSIKPDWTCVDVGGHIGSFLAKLTDLAPQGRMIVVEADQEKAKMLARGFPFATVHAVAVSNEDGEAVLFRNLSKPGFSSLSNREDRGKTQEVIVPKCKLDTLLKGAKIDFIKFDVEGFELEAIMGARETIVQSRPIILFEAGGSADKSIDTSKASKLFHLLVGSLGYDVFAAIDLKFNRPHLDSSTFESYRRYPFIAFNYFAIPRNVETSQAGGPI